MALPSNSNFMGCKPYGGPEQKLVLGSKTLCFHIPSMKYSKLWVSEMLGNWVGFTHDSIEAKDNSHTT
jgi:hypothetical protein